MKALISLFRCVWLELNSTGQRHSRNDVAYFRFKTPQKLIQWPWCYCAWLASKLTWPEPHRESIGYCQEEDERHQTQQCRWPEGRYQSNLGFHYTWAVPQADCLHATPHWCSNSSKRRPNQVLKAYTCTYFSEAWHFCLKYPFFIDLIF